MKHLILLAALCGLSVCAQAQQTQTLQGRLIIFHAGSLSVPMKAMVGEFAKLHPQLTITTEAAGSRECARKITDLDKPCDVMASADYEVIDSLLIPTHASWSILFAGNEMAIVYREQSRRATEVNADNWYEILLDPNVAYGRADPDSDPCGYRAVLCAKLAQRHYGKPGLADRLLAKDRNHIRPKETDLLALLESGTIDYLFLYRSVAEQHHLKYVVLPDQVNLKNPAMADLYAQQSVELSGKKPGEKVMQKGAPMVYGITIPTSSPNPKAALAFVQFVLSRDQGLAILKKMGQPPVVPSVCPTYDHLPAELKQFALDPKAK
jgi:molybdate/tungstate transport system substrate-binding protein